MDIIPVRLKNAVLRILAHSKYRAYYLPQPQVLRLLLLWLLLFMLCVKHAWAVCVSCWPCHLSMQAPFMATANSRATCVLHTFGGTRETAVQKQHSHLLACCSRRGPAPAPAALQAGPGARQRRPGARERRRTARRPRRSTPRRPFGRAPPASSLASGAAGPLEATALSHAGNMYGLMVRHYPLQLSRTPTGMLSKLLRPRSSCL